MDAFAGSWQTQHPGHNIVFRAKEDTLTTSICHNKEVTCVGVGPSWIDALSKTLAAFENSITNVPTPVAPEDSSKKSASKADEPDQRTTSKSLNEWAREVHRIATEHGFHEDEANPHRIAQYIANLHGEVSELWEAFRTGTLTNWCDKLEVMGELGLPALSCAEEEIADILIRTLDTAIGLGITDIESVVRAKSKYNESRRYKRGGKKA
jgi:NTP pyrophosphatase (non-canonical NTP hydrolase)